MTCAYRALSIVYIKILCCITEVSGNNEKELGKSHVLITVSIINDRIRNWKVVHGKITVFAQVVHLICHHRLSNCIDENNKRDTDIVLLNISLDI